MLGGVSFRGVGIVILNLHEMAASLDAQANKYPLSKCPDGHGMVECVMTAKFIGDLDADDAGSDVSGSTADNASVTDAAEFEGRAQKAASSSQHPSQVG